MNFEYWAELAASDPQRFAVERKQALTAAALEAPEHLRASLLDLVAALTSESSGSPLQDAVNAQNLMLRSLAQLQEAFSQLLQATQQVKPDTPLYSFMAFEVRDIPEQGSQVHK